MNFLQIAAKAYDLAATKTGFVQYAIITKESFGLKTVTLYHVPRLWALAENVPAFEVSLTDLTAKNKDFYISQDRLESAATDQQYPILIDKDNLILDGRHRLTSAIANGRETVFVKRLTNLPKPFSTTNNFMTSYDGDEVLKVYVAMAKLLPKTVGAFIHEYRRIATQKC